MGRAARDPDTGDLFAAGDRFPVRLPTPEAEAPSFDARLKRAISQALRECPLSRDEIAAKMRGVLGQPSFSKHMLDAYAAESRDTHKISVERFVALVRVTGAIWLLDLLAAQLGCLVLEGEEARLAERGLVDQQLAELLRRKQAFKQAPPVTLRRRRAAR